jgi:hypothetical protein
MLYVLILSTWCSYYEYYDGLCTVLSHNDLSLWVFAIARAGEGWQHDGVPWRHHPLLVRTSKQCHDLLTLDAC